MVTEACFVDRLCSGAPSSGDGEALLEVLVTLCIDPTIRFM